LLDLGLGVPANASDPVSPMNTRAG
jgi:hypothetical protein